MAYATVSDWTARYGHRFGTVAPSLLTAQLDAAADYLDGYLGRRTLAPDITPTVRMRSNGSASIHLPDWPLRNPEMWTTILGRLRTYDPFGILLDEYDVTRLTPWVDRAGRVALNLSLIPGTVIDVSYVRGYTTTVTTVTPSSVTSSGQTVTVTANGHGLSAGQPIAVVNATPFDYRGAYKVAAATTNTFTYSTPYNVTNLAAATVLPTIYALPITGTYPAVFVEATCLMAEAFLETTRGLQDGMGGPGVASTRVPMLRAQEMLDPFRVAGGVA